VGRNQYGVAAGGSWGVCGTGICRLNSQHDTQREAIGGRLEISRKQQSELFSHRRDGRILERASEGHDPRPPKG
jgi:hypothetical protein